MVAGATLKVSGTSSAGGQGSAMPHYQAILVGCGGLGCAKLYRLAGRLGPGILGIEQFRLGHERGGSQDHSRIVRLAPHQPGKPRSPRPPTQAWHEVEKASGQQIVTITGAQIVENTPVRSVKPTTADAEVPADEHTYLAPEGGGCHGHHCARRHGPAAAAAGRGVH
jgi:hypothetical protein